MFLIVFVLKPVLEKFIESVEEWKEKSGQSPSKKAKRNDRIRTNKQTKFPK